MYMPHMGIHLSKLVFTHMKIFLLILTALFCPSSLTQIFVEMVRGQSRRHEHLTAVCKEELLKLDQRVESGEVLEAVLELSLAKSKL